MNGVAKGGRVGHDFELYGCTFWGSKKRDWK